MKKYKDSCSFVIKPIFVSHHGKWQKKKCVTPTCRNHVSSKGQHHVLCKHCSSRITVDFMHVLKRDTQIFSRVTTIIDLE